MKIESNWLVEGLELASHGSFQTSMAEKSRLCVLVVDDERLIRWSLAETLTEAGHDVAEAEDGTSAIRAVSQSVPDVVLLDFRLPDSDDLNLLTIIRKLAPRSQVILMTAFGTPDVVRGALDLGTYRVVGKPFEVRDLAALVEQAHASRAEE
jgi:DNA-binding NtrC family response regulator